VIQSATDEEYEFGPNRTSNAEQSRLSFQKPGIFRNNPANAAVVQ